MHLESSQCHRDQPFQVKSDQCHASDADLEVPDYRGLFQSEAYANAI